MPHRPLFTISFPSIPYRDCSFYWSDGGWGLPRDHLGDHWELLVLDCRIDGALCLNTLAP